VSSDAASAPAPAVGELHLITFGLDREEYGIRVGQVREVIRVSEITRVPQAPDQVRGVTNLRGRILPVVEIRSRLGLEPAVVTPRSRIIVVEVRDRVLGLLVDAVLQVTKVPLDTVTPPPDEVLSPGTDYITGVARWGGRLIILLELDKVLLLQE
jgi:purine-binding chemotaxis protein CheW